LSARGSRSALESHRAEAKFDSVDALVRRMDDDARLARAALARAGDAFPPLSEISS